MFQLSPFKSLKACVQNLARYSFMRTSKDDLVDFLQRIRKAYVEGLCWVLVYYYQAAGGLLNTHHGVACDRGGYQFVAAAGLSVLDLVLSLPLCVAWLNLGLRMWGLCVVRVDTSCSVGTKLEMEATDRTTLLNVSPAY